MTDTSPSFFDHHDRYFKSALGSVEGAKSFFARFLPAPIADRLDFGSLESIPTETVDESLDRTQMDLAFSARLEGTGIVLYLLMEHKSTPDSGTFLQLLRYMVALWTKDKREGRRPTPVLPFVFYSGEGAWTLPRRFSEFANAPEILAPYSLDFAPEIFDIQRIPDEEIVSLDRIEVRVSVLTMKHVFEDLEAVITLLRPHIRSLRAGDLGVVVEYLHHAKKVEERVIVEEIDTQLRKGENVPNLIETLLEEGRQEGLQKGLQEGRQEGRREDIAKLLRKKVLSPGEIATALDVDLSWVLEIGRELDQPS